MDEHLQAVELMASRGLAHELGLGKLPGLDVWVFRLEPGRAIPRTRVYFRDDGEVAVLLAIEVVPEEEA
jgi:hypothetical protein